MPPIAQLASAFGAGLWTGLSFFIPHGAFWLLVPAAGWAALRGRWWGVLVGASAAGMVCGTLRAGMEAAECRQVWTPGRNAAVLVVHDAPGESGVTTASVQHAPHGCRGTLRISTEARLPAGGSIVAVGTYLSLGVFRVTHHRVLRARPHWRFRLRGAIEARIRRLYGVRAGLVEALVLGRRDDLPRSLRQTFADAGIAHLLAISGLHVGVFSTWILWLLRLAGVGRRRWLVGAGICWGYVLLLGAPSSATRAAAFLSLYAAARLRERHPPLEAVLAAALLLILSVEPSAATSVGLWLSGSAVMGTAWAGRCLRRHRHRPNAALRLAATSGGAVLFTSPITAFAFGSAAPVGILTNLVAIPLSGVAVPGIFLSLAAGAPLAAGAGLVLTVIERLADLSARAPLGHVAGSPGAAFAAPWLALLAVTWYLAGAAGTLFRRRARRALALGAAGAWVGLAAPAWLARGRAHTLEMHVLDVGQGDAILVRTPASHWILIDAGPRTSQGDAGHRVVLPYLRRAGVRVLSAVIATHGDADHIGGMPAVLAAVDAQLVLEPAQPLGTNLYLELQAVVAERGLEWRPARTGDTITVDGVSIAVLHPSAAWMARQFEPNENSVVLHLRFGCFDALLAGDAGLPVERELLASLPKVEVLKVGHHGSAGGTSLAWVRALAPATAVVSVGANGFGHPNPQVIERLRAEGVDVWRTDRGGSVTIRTDGGYYSVYQRGPATLIGSVLCRIRRLSRSSGSSSSRNGCTPKPPVTSPICFTTSRLPPR